MRGPVAFPVADAARHMAHPWYALVPALSATTTTVTLTADTAAHTKGAWTEVIASAAFDVALIVVNVGGVGVSATNTATLLDIALGGAGSEVPIVSNIAVGGASSGIGSGTTFTIPVFIRRGQRISARIQSIVTGGKTATITMRLATGDAPWRTPTIVDTLGTSTATSAATSMSGTIETYVEIAAATTNAYSALVLVPSIATNGMTAATMVYTLGIGPAGSEQVVGVVYATTTTTELLGSGDGAGPNIFGADVAAGRRIAVRCSGNTAGLQACVLGIRRTV